MLYDRDKREMVLSLDEITSLACKSGSIDVRHPVQSRSYSTVSSDMLWKIYKDEGSYAESMVPLILSHEYGGLRYTVSALADAVVKRDGRLRVDVVRAVKKYDFYAPPSHELLSYLKCVGLFCAKKENFKTVCLRIYFVYEEKAVKIKHFDYFYTLDELELGYNELIDRISARVRATLEREESVLPTVADCVFPYNELRAGQQIMIKECYSAIKQGKRIFLQAPTGTGKTVASLYPAVRAIGNGLCDKVFYLTSKASTRREAFKGASKLYMAGAELRTIVIGAREQVCLCGARTVLGATGKLCNPVDCPYAAGYYDKVESAISELLAEGHGYTIKQIATVAEKYEVCPYELSLDLSELCDIIICDYNYIFDPAVYFRRYFGAEGGRNERYVFLIDEAHNLPDRARDMYSFELSNRVLEDVFAKIDPEEKSLFEMFEKMVLAFRAEKRLCRDTLAVGADGVERGFYISNTELAGFGDALEVFKKRCEGWLRKNETHGLYYDINSLIGDIKRYLCVREYFDSRFYNYVYVEGDTVSVKIFCLDPSYILDKIQKRAISTVMFSATLMPPDYFSEILGGGKDAIRVSLPSAFDPKNLCVAVASHVSTRYEERKKSYQKYAQVIAATVSRKAGNYIAYFPSYDCLAGTYDAFVKKYPKVATAVQKRGMTFSDKEEFLNFFRDDEGVLRVGFCVLGGSFSEGVDLPGARLIGAVIFGVGLPGLSNEKNIMRDYYDNRGGSGYDYAYTFPGMNNVLQAAGRVIRTDKDRGVVVLADDRYTEEKYKMLFPEHWESVKCAKNASELAGIIQNFWNLSDF